MRIYKRTVDNTVDMAVDRSTARLTDKVKTHFAEYKKIYLGVAGGIFVGASLSRRSQISITVSPTIMITPEIEKVPETIIVPAESRE